MELIWGLDDFDASLPMNVPSAMLAEPDFEHPQPDQLLYQGVDITDDFDPHIEFYAIFRNRLQKKLNQTLTHGRIVHEALYLIEHESLKICWFRTGDEIDFRCMRPARRMPWWTARQWQSGQTPPPMDFWTRKTFKVGGLKKIVDIVHSQIDLARQQHWYHQQLATHSHD